MPNFGKEEKTRYFIRSGQKFRNISANMGYKFHKKMSVRYSDYNIKLFYNEFTLNYEWGKYYGWLFEQWVVEIRNPELDLSLVKPTVIRKVGLITTMRLKKGRKIRGKIQHSLENKRNFLLSKFSKKIFSFFILGTSEEISRIAWNRRISLHVHEQ